jgi:hypothetical protein
MSVANRGALINQFDRDILKMFRNARLEAVSEWNIIAKAVNAPAGKDYTEAEVTGLGTMYEVAEGAGVVFDIPEEGHKKTRYYKKWGLGFQVTEEAINDELFGMYAGTPKALSTSAENILNARFFRLFNLGDTAESSDGEESWDGQPIFSDSHTTLKSGDTIDNKGTAALSETSFQAAHEYFDNLVTEEGFPTDIMGDTLMIPPKLRWMAGRLANQMGGLTSALTGATGDLTGITPLGGQDLNLSGNINTMNPTHGLVGAWQPLVFRYLSAAQGGSDSAWFFISRPNHDFNMMWKWKPRMESADEFRSGNRLYKMTTRFLPYCNQYKAAYGSYPV